MVEEYLCTKNVSRQSRVQTAFQKDGLCNERTPRVARRPTTAHGVENRVWLEITRRVKISSEVNEREITSAREVTRDDWRSSKETAQACWRRQLVKITSGISF